MPAATSASAGPRCTDRGHGKEVAGRLLHTSSVAAWTRPPATRSGGRSPTATPRGRQSANARRLRSRVELTQRFDAISSRVRTRSRPLAILAMPPAHVDNRRLLRRHYTAHRSVSPAGRYTPDARTSCREEGAWPTRASNTETKVAPRRACPRTASASSSSCSWQRSSSSPRARPAIGCRSPPLYCRAPPSSPPLRPPGSVVACGARAGRCARRARVGIGGVFVGGKWISGSLFLLNVFPGRRRTGQ